MQGILPAGACAGMFSKEILVLAAKTRDTSVLETFQKRLADYFGALSVETFCHRHRLQVEIGGTLATRGVNACTAVQEALATSKKYV